MWHWLIVAVILAFLVWLLRSGRSSNSPQVPVAQYAWPPLGDYDFEVVGESHYQRVLKALRDSMPDRTQPAIGTAILVPDDNNPHDNKAVRVTVGGHTIGHLTRDDARSYRRRLGSKKLGMVPASCGLLVTGGHILQDGSRAYFGAQLDMESFDN